MPDVSVIVPAHNAAATLPGTLAALERQSGAVDFEVIVVDDGSSDETGALAQAAGVEVIRHDSPRGAAAARNEGAARARGRLLAFTDSDCEPDASWLEHAVKAAEGADLVQGSVVPDPTVPAGIFDRTVHVERESGLFETANLLVSREWFERVEGFRPFVREDAAAPGHGLRPRLGERPQGEDTLFGWRLRRLGGTTAFAGDARVFHEVQRRSPTDFVLERWRLRFFPTLVREVPELRTIMPLRLFQSPRRAMFDVAVAGLACAAMTRRAEPLLAVVPYAARCLPVSHLPQPWAVRESVALAAADAVGGLALLRGSITARQLVL